LFPPAQDFGITPLLRVASRLSTQGMCLMTANLLTLATIGLVHLLAVMSPGPSFLITARTAVAQSRTDGIKVALGLGAGSVVWSAAALLASTCCSASSTGCSSA